MRALRAQTARAREAESETYMAREDTIRESMRAVGVYNEIFEPAIKSLAKAERQLSRAEKEWRAQGGKMVAELVNKTGAAYTAKDPYWTAVEQLRKDVQSMRNQLGLTPTGLNKARARGAELPGRLSKIEELLASARETAIERAGDYMSEVDAYVEGVLSGDILACPEIRQACARYVSDLDTGCWDFRADEANLIIAIIETTICHQQGEALDGTPMRGQPFILLPYHKFCVYNIMGFYQPGTQLRRYIEALIFVPRKNVKTTFAAALAWAFALYYRESGSKVYEVGGALKQALEGFDFLKYNVQRLGLAVDDDPEHGLRIINNNMERSISGDVGDGFISINALATSPDKQDSFNANVIIADEMHTYKSAKQYQVLKDATKAYSNKLVIGISTAGSLEQGFCARRVEFCRRILNGSVTGDIADRTFVYIAAAEAAENGEVAYDDPKTMEACNPGWGQSIRPADMIADAQLAREDPQMRPEFLTKSLNVFIQSLRAYFDISEWRASDEKYDWSLEELARLPIQWYGGSDLSKLYDLTAACLFGHYKGVDIIVPHCWFPRPAAIVKAEQDQIPLFGWLDDGWLYMTNDKVTNHADVVRWYKERRAQGFKIRRVGHDRKFCREYYVAMKEAHFSVRDQPQTALLKNEGFKYLLNSAKAGTLYYCHAEPFEYCVQNVHGVDKADDVTYYDKLADNLRIDVFDCAVFAACTYLIDLEKRKKGSGWYGTEEGSDAD